MYIEIYKIKFKNFMSYQAEVVYEIQNSVILINGTNGKGKSSILEAIYYGLFGRSFRKISNSELINSVQGKNLEVQIFFRIQSDEYQIIRGMKPNKFEIYKNNDLILQDSKSLDYQKMLEENILKTNDNVFKQLVLLGANIPTSKNFSELSNKEREEIFKYIIDIGIFSEYNDIAKTRIKELKQDVQQVDSNLNQLHQLKIKLKQDIERQEFQNKNAHSIKEEKIKTLQNEKDLILSNIEKIKAAQINMQDSQLETLKLELKLEENLLKDKNLELSTIQDNVRNARQKLELIFNLEKSHTPCLSCSELVKISGIDVKEKEFLTESIKLNAININAIKENIQKLNDSINIIKQKEKLVETIKLKLNSLEVSYNNINEKIKIIEDVELAIINYSTLEDLIIEEKKLIENKIQLENKTIDFLSFQDLISDKNLKGQILDMSLPIINKWINYFLEKFGNFPFLFTINSDLSENIITMDGSNIQKSFNSLSNGQKLRIVFSILFAFLKFSEERNTTHFNILFLDEVLDSSLDTDGRLELINILRTEFTNRSINIISHNTEIKEAEEIFENMYEVLSNENGSYLKNLKNIQQRTE
jgi:DNA repair exonuclease SbcCD ATPase subunit